MIITIDVGNTNITVGVFNGDEIVASFRMTTKMPRTSDEYGMLLTNLLEQNRETIKKNLKATHELSLKGDVDFLSEPSVNTKKDDEKKPKSRRDIMTKYL